MHKRWVAAEMTGSSTLPYAPCHIIRNWQTESRLHVTEHRNGKDIREEEGRRSITDDAYVIRS